MRESPRGFSYSWADLAPIRILAVSIFVGQVAGGAVQWVRSPYADWFLNIWTGGALGGFAGYLVGLLLQARFRPGSIAANIVMVRRIGLIALFLLALALVFPLGWGSAR